MSLHVDATGRGKISLFSACFATAPPLICGKLIIFILELSVGVCGGASMRTAWLFGARGTVSRGGELRGGRV